MEKVLIFGSQGMLGSELVRKFSVSHTVVGLDRRAFDITDTRQIEEAINRVEPTIILNATAYNSVDEAEKSPESFALAWRINGTAVGELAKLCQKYQVPLMHFSTDYVFDGENRSGYDETSPTNPVNKYGETKSLGEKLLQSATGQFYLVRLSRLFGPPGASPKAKKSFVDIILDLALKQGKQEIKLVDEEISCPTYSADLAELAGNLAIKNAPYGIYHGSNTGGVSWYGLAQEVFALKKLTVKLIAIKSKDYPRPARRPLFSALLNTKLPPQRNWQDALRDYLRV